MVCLLVLKMSRFFDLFVFLFTFNCVRGNFFFTYFAIINLFRLRLFFSLDCKMCVCFVVVDCFTLDKWLYHINDELDTISFYFGCHLICPQKKKYNANKKTSETCAPVSTVEY